MAKVVLFPEISSLEWLKGHGDNSSVWLERDCRLYSLFIGRVVSTLLSKGIEKILLRRRVDITVVHFFAALVRYITLAFAAIAALGRLGIETSSIIAVIGAAGLAVGLALQGSLSNFAAGVLLVTLRPFRAGNLVQIGAITEWWKPYIYFPPPYSPRIIKTW
jgi:small-conductance mechanosensitive channel